MNYYVRRVRANNVRIYFPVTSIHLCLGTYNPVLKEIDCNNGFTTEYFDAQFRDANPMHDIEFDSFCYTDDLVTMNCCLEDWMGGKESRITDYAIHKL